MRLDKATSKKKYQLFNLQSIHIKTLSHEKN